MGEQGRERLARGLHQRIVVERVHGLTEQSVPVRHQSPLLKEVVGDVEQVGGVGHAVVEVQEPHRQAVIERLSARVDDACVGEQRARHAQIQKIVRPLVGEHTALRECSGTQRLVTRGERCAALAVERIQRGRERCKLAPHHRW